MRLCMLSDDLYLKSGLSIRSAALAATIIVAALVLPEVMLGNTEASAIRRPSKPCTFNSEFTTVSSGSSQLLNCAKNSSSVECGHVLVIPHG